MHISEIEKYLQQIELPIGPVKLNQFETILNVRDFIDGHLTFLKSNPNNRLYKPYYDRLLKFIKNENRI